MIDVRKNQEQGLGCGCFLMLSGISERFSETSNPPWKLYPKIFPKIS
jgi:hypothetical protein